MPAFCDDTKPMRRVGDTVPFIAPGVAVMRCMVEVTLYGVREGLRRNAEFFHHAPDPQDQSVASFLRQGFFHSWGASS